MRSRLRSTALLLFALAATTPASAGTQHFYYDPVGRLVGETQTAGDIRFSQTDKADNPQLLNVFPYLGPSAVNTLCSLCGLIADTSLTSTDGAYKLTLQDDGNLVIYQTSNNTPVWCTHTSGNQPGIFINSGGDLVLYAPNYTMLWQSNTPGQSGTQVVLQTNGTLVLSGSSGTIWTSSGGC